MMRPQVTKLRIPRSPALPNSSGPSCSEKWILNPSFDSKIRSCSSLLRCLDAGVKANLDGALVLTLSIKYYDLAPSPNSCVKIILGDDGITTNVATTKQGDGSTTVWGVLPSALLIEGQMITLQVLEDDTLVLDQLLIGSVELLSDQPIEPSEELLISSTSPRLSSPSTEVDELDECLSDDASDEHSLNKEGIPPDYKRLSLKLEEELDPATEDWSATEEKAGRRLVRFVCKRAGSQVHLSWAAHNPLHICTTKDDVFISCIKLPELGGYYVTSFDIVKLAEYILDQKLNTDMKNRARRNMSSIPCTTLEKIAEKDASPTNDFITVMRFWDPKPRSIEKSIKVYHWSLLESCLTKILHRFIIHLPEICIKPAEFEHQLEATNKWKRNKRNKHSSSRPSKPRREPSTPALIYDESLKSKRPQRQARNPQVTPVTTTPNDEQPVLLGQVSEKEEEKCVDSLEKEDNVQSIQKHEEALPKRPSSPLQKVRAILPVASRSSVLLRPRLVVSTQVIPGVPTHPSLQHRPTGLVNVPVSEPVLPSPTNSSFSSYSPSLVSPQNPHYTLSGSGGSSTGLPLSPGASDPPMSSTSTIGTPKLWPLPPAGIDNRLSMNGAESSQLPGGYVLDNGYLHVSQPGTPTLVHGFSVYPTYPSYPTHGSHTYHMSESLQETLINRDIKEEEKEFDTNEWLNLDYITEQERNHPN